MCFLARKQMISSYLYLKNPYAPFPRSVSVKASFDFFAFFVWQKLNVDIGLFGALFTGHLFRA